MQRRTMASMHNILEDPSKVVRTVTEGKSLASAIGFPETALDLAYVNAGRAFAQGDYAAAVNGFAIVAALRHTDAKAWVALARALMAEEAMHAAAVAYRAALEIAPEAELYAELARAEMGAGDPQAAREALADGRAHAAPLPPKTAEEYDSLETLLTEGE